MSDNEVVCVDCGHRKGHHDTRSGHGECCGNACSCEQFRAPAFTAFSVHPGQDRDEQERNRPVTPPDSGRRETNDHEISSWCAVADGGLVPVAAYRALARDFRAALAASAPVAPRERTPQDYPPPSGVLPHIVAIIPPRDAAPPAGGTRVMELAGWLRLRGLHAYVDTFTCPEEFDAAIAEIAAALAASAT